MNAELTNEIQRIFTILANLSKTSKDDAETIAKFIQTFGIEYGTLAEAVDGMAQKQEDFELYTRAGIISREEKIAYLEKRIRSLENSLAASVFALENGSPELALKALQSAKV